MAEREMMLLDLGGDAHLELLPIPAGKFLMGSPPTEEGREEREGPQHEVTISQPFYMGKYPVTQEEYEKGVEKYEKGMARRWHGWLAQPGTKPSRFKGARNPVEYVNWNEAQKFCQSLSQGTGKTVRLPTEAEWEYACRAGTTTRFYTGDTESGLDSAGWHRGNSWDLEGGPHGRTHPVGLKQPNAWGLYDMHGNVWEWCQDWYDENYYATSPACDPQGPENECDRRVVRGGAFAFVPAHCRSACRYGFFQGFRDIWYGFRIVVSASGTTHV